MSRMQNESVWFSRYLCLENDASKNLIQLDRVNTLQPIVAEVLLGLRIGSPYIAFELGAHLCWVP